jgi:Fe-S cluster assembly iron-binding protein IscA
MQMFAAGMVDLPGVTVYSPDDYYDAHPHDLATIGRACFQFKNTIPTDGEFQAIAERLTDEFDQTPRMVVPARLSDGRQVFLGATMFHRVRLPGRILRASALPMVIAPELTEINMVLPLAYWSPELHEAWGNLQERLDGSQITSTAQRVARNAEKRPREQAGPDWDVAAIPVHVTPAMAEELVAQAERLGLEARPMLSIGFSSDGAKTADLVMTYDPDTEIVFTSSGVGVVVRRDQLERLRGTVVDFKSSAFDAGVVIRLPGD